MLTRKLFFFCAEGRRQPAGVVPGAGPQRQRPRRGGRLDGPRVQQRASAAGGRVCVCVRPTPAPRRRRGAAARRCRPWPAVHVAAAVARGPGWRRQRRVLDAGQRRQALAPAVRHAPFQAES